MQEEIDEIMYEQVNLDSQAWMEFCSNKNRSKKFPHPYNQETGMFEDTDKYREAEAELKPELRDLNLNDLRKNLGPPDMGCVNNMKDAILKLSGVSADCDPELSILPHVPLEIKTLNALIDLTMEIRGLRQDLKEYAMYRKDNHGFYTNDAKESE